MMDAAAPAVNGSRKGSIIDGMLIFPVQVLVLVFILAADGFCRQWM